MADKTTADKERNERAEALIARMKKARGARDVFSFTRSISSNRPLPVRQNAHLVVRCRARPQRPGGALPAAARPSTRIRLDSAACWRIGIVFAYSGEAYQCLAISTLSNWTTTTDLGFTIPSSTSKRPSTTMGFPPYGANEEN